MAKLYFRYGAMNSGKSTALLQAAHNYEERGQRVLLAKPAVDTKAAGRIASRLGVEREADILIAPDTDMGLAVTAARDAMRRATGRDVACVLVDEAQFLTPTQVEALIGITVDDGIPVIAYGIRTDFQTRAFPGSARLLELAHSLEELKTICRCGRKAVYNARLSGGRFVFDGDQVAIDALDPATITYEALCAEDYLRASGGRLG